MLNLHNQSILRKWKTFLKSLGISNFNDSEIETIDITFGLFNDGGDLIATGSTAGNVLKYIGACNKFTAQGSNFNTIVSTLINYLAERGIFHLFVFTKHEYSKSFQHIGFSELAHTDDGAVLETGDASVSEYVANIPQINSQENMTVAGIVINANPFTLGHQFLVEKAAAENDLVYVFIVNNDVSLFSTAVREKLVKEGVSHLSNVIVVNGSYYMVSYVTFPAYFLSTPNKAIEYQTTLDAKIFKNRIAPGLNLTKRYLGSEPRSRTTSIYNATLQRELPPEIEVKVINRLLTDEGKVITATEVREAIRDRQIKKIRSFVPNTTYQYIKDHFDELQDRIKKGMKISGN